MSFLTPGDLSDPEIKPQSLVFPAWQVNSLPLSYLGSPMYMYIYNEKIVGHTYISLLGGSAGKESACNVGDLGLIPGLGRSPGGGKGYPLQYSGLEKSKD